MENETNKLPPSTNLLEILSKVDKESPSDQNLNEVKNFLTEDKGEHLPLKRLSQNLISNQINKTFTTSEELRADLALGAEELRNELGYTASSTIEQMLIDEIPLEFLRMHQMQLLLSELTSKPGTQLLTLKKVSDLAGAAQNRFNKAVQMLTKLRKAGIKLQINIATEGG